MQCAEEEAAESREAIKGEEAAEEKLEQQQKFRPKDSLGAHSPGAVPLRTAAANQGSSS